KGASSTDRVSVAVTDLVILVHGWRGSAESFLQMGDFLGADFTVIAFDYRDITPCLLACADDIYSIARRLASFLASIIPSNSPYLGKVDVLAHSMGGLVVRTYAAGRVG